MSPKNTSAKEDRLPQEVIPSRRMKTILSWKAPGGVFKKKDKEFWTTILSIAFLISVILFFAKEYFLIATIFALIFLFYVSSINPPQIIKYKITNQGIFWGKTKYEWQSLWRFWFQEKEGQTILDIDTHLAFPKRLTLPLGNQDKKEVRRILEGFIPYEKVGPDFIEKSTRWLAKTFPLESKKVNKK